MILKDPETDDRAMEVMEVMEYVVGTMHPQGFTRLFRTDRFAPSASDHEAVKAQGRDRRCSAVLRRVLGGKAGRHAAAEELRGAL